MQTYRVGGVVRDALLGRAAADIDYVVVGATPQQMLDQGFVAVGADFPVFIHPETGHEYALARTERKSGKGHKGFDFHADPDVTLEQDLSRRDFTVNSMADDGNGCLVDPYGGRRDLSQRILRHVSPAFSEDPLRVLRAARYCSQLKFTVAPETLELMSQLVQGGELEHLPAERIWQELHRGLLGDDPAAMIEMLRSCGALAKILPEVDALFGVAQNPASHPEGCAGVHTLLVVRVARLNWWPTEVIWAVLLHDVGKALTPEEKLPFHPGHEKAGVRLVRQACDRLKVPSRFAKAAVAVAREHGCVHAFAKLDVAEVVAFFNRLGAWRDCWLLDVVLAAAGCDHAAHPDICNHDLHPNRALVRRVYEAALKAEVATAAKDNPADPKAAVHAARSAAVAAALADA